MGSGLATLAPRRIAARLAEGLDRPLLAISAALVLVGLVTLYSATHGTPVRLSAQLANLAVGATAMWIAAQIPPQTLMRFAFPAYVGGLGLLLVVALFGEVVNGARRWLDLGFLRFQPSELMKLALPLALASYFHRREGTLRLRDFAAAAAIAALPVALVARQPDLGTALLVAASGFTVLFFAGIGWKVLAGLGIAGLAAAPLAWGLLHDYQRRRILTLFDPTQDPLGAGYHTIQSTIAVGSGGIGGKGWLRGTQAHLDFIPERHTDFIFAVYAEEFGLVGSLALLALYTALVVRGLMIAAKAATVFARLVGASLSLMFFTYAFVNIGMVAGILPVVGVPLPFVSYGGSALATLFVAIGILMSAQRHRRLVQT